MALKLNGKDDRLTRKDFMALARTIDLPAARAEALREETVAGVQEGLAGLALPKFAKSKAATATAGEIRKIVAARSSLTRPDR
jgi:serine/threonine-protein kinase HipA